MSHKLEVEERRSLASYYTLTTGVYRYQQQSSPEVKRERFQNDGVESGRNSVTAPYYGIARGKLKIYYCNLCILVAYIHFCRLKNSAFCYRITVSVRRLFIHLYFTIIGSIIHAAIFSSLCTHPTVPRMTLKGMGVRTPSLWPCYW